MSKILPDPLTKTTDTPFVSSNYNIAELDPILLNLIQSETKVTLERLVRVFPYPITTESRRRKLQRFLDLPELTIARSLVPIERAQYAKFGAILSGHDFERSVRERRHRGRIHPQF